MARSAVAADYLVMKVGAQVMENAVFNVQ